MTIIQQPDALSFSLTMKPLIISADSQVAVELLRGDATVITQSYTPATDGSIEIDLRDLVHGMLSASLPLAGEVTEQTAVIAPFTARLTDGTESRDIAFTALAGGVEGMGQGAATWCASNFLTWQPSTKGVTYHTPEWLAYCTRGGVNVCLHAAMADGTGQDLTLATLPATDGYKVYSLPVGYSYVCGRLAGDALPRYYDVWVAEPDGTRLTYIQRYHADGLRGAEEDWVLFANSLGGIDTFRAYGHLQLAAEHTHHIAEVAEQGVEYRVDTQRQWSKHTGRLTGREARWLLDFFPARSKWLYADASIRPIVVTESSAEGEVRHQPVGYSFKFRFASSLPLLCLPRTDEPQEVLTISLPDVASFTVPPRLCEFPQQVLTEGVLFPVQEPHSEGWGVTTVSALAAVISQLLSAGAGTGGGVGHSHANIDVLRRLGMLGEYLTMNGEKLLAGRADEAAHADHAEEADHAALAHDVDEDSPLHTEFDTKALSCDTLEVRRRATFAEVLIKMVQHAGGELVLTPASMVCSRVEEAADAYRCHFRTDDGERTVFNEFRAGDQARCQTFNIKAGVYQNVANRYYWRLVTAVGDDWVELSKTDCDPSAANDIPAAGDHIVQLGNRTDVERQGAIILSTVGADAPSLKQYSGISSYTLEGCEGNILSHTLNRLVGDFIAEATGTSLTDDMKSMEELLSGQMDELDAKLGQVTAATGTEYTLWFFPYNPTAITLPEVEWTDNATRALHTGDIFYNEDTGHAFRYEHSEADGTFGWTEITDRQTLLALERASKAQDTADAKRRVFAARPLDTDGYDVGDLWVNATYPSDGSQYKNDLLRCVTAKAAGTPFSIDHWQAASEATSAVLSAMDGRITAVANRFNPDGSLKNRAGLVAEDDFASLFAEAVDADGDIVKRAEVDTFVKKDAAGNVEAGIRLKADQIEFLGKTMINGNFVVDTDGNVTMRNFTAVDGSFSGHVFADGGKIADFNVYGDSIGTTNDTETNGMNLRFDALTFRGGSSYTRYGIDAMVLRGANIYLQEGAYIAGMCRSFRQVGTDYIMTPADSVVRCVHTSGTISVTLPANLLVTGDPPAGREVWIYGAGGGTTVQLQAVNGVSIAGVQRLTDPRWYVYFYDAAARQWVGGSLGS